MNEFNEKRVMVYIEKEDHAFDVKPFLIEYYNLFKTRKGLVELLEELEDALRILYTSDQIAPEKVDKLINVVRGLKKGIAKIISFNFILEGSSMRY